MRTPVPAGAFAMNHRTLQVLYGYWNELRRGRLAPHRLEIEPSRIAAILAETFMLERAGASAFPYRLAGTKLCEHLGTELRGTDFLDGWDDDSRLTLERQLGSVCSQGAVALFTVEASSGPNHRLVMEGILLPLLHGGDSIGRIIGAMSATSAPPWLTSEKLAHRRLVRHEQVWPDGRPHSLLERAPLAAPFVPATPDPRRAPGRPQFRLLQGGRAFAKPDKV